MWCEGRVVWCGVKGVKADAVPTGRRVRVRVGAWWVQGGAGGGDGEGQGAGEGTKPWAVRGGESESGHRNDMVDIEVVLAAIGVLVPFHRLLERLHRPVELVDIVVLRPHREPHLGTGMRMRMCMCM